MDDDRLIVRDEGPVRWLLFNRPASRNAQDWPMLKQLIDVLLEVKHDPSVRVLILGGEGPSFSAGHDLKQPSRSPEWAAATRSAEDRYRTELRYFVEPVELLRSLPMPTICRVQGACMAAGLMFSSATDLVVAAEDARFGTTVLSGGGIVDSEIPTLAWLLGARRAKQLLWLGESMSAAEALDVGYVNWVVPVDELDQKVREVAARLIKSPAITLELSKLTFDFMSERRGERDFNRFHYITHQLSHHTTEGLAAQRVRDQRVADGVSLRMDGSELDLAPPSESETDH